MNRAVIVAAALTLFSGQQVLADPLNSGNWEWVKDYLFEDAETVFDDRVVVKAPKYAEDNMNVPFVVDARALDDVQKIVVFADSNPILRVLTMEPTKAEPFIASALKMQQGGPVRAAALTSDGVWHVGGVFVDAAGGGCTAPASVHAQDNWMDHLGEMHAKSWIQPDGSQRATVRLYHPMDTGLADGIPAFFVEKLDIKGEAGEILARIQPAEPVMQHPRMTVLVKPEAGSSHLEIDGRDTEANLYQGQIDLNWDLAS
ncbi:MAG: quinoprotein dehydrogenase-associated SoxYZ-like carrier [Geminicoccaceae bacterium]